MNPVPSHDPLRDALRSLPRARPGDDFTDRVLERTAAAPRGARPVRRQLRWAAAAVLASGALAGGLYLTAGSGTPAPAESRRAELETLESERLRLSAELAEIRRLAASLDEPAPVLYLGGDDEIDLVLDLDRLARERAAAMPAGYRGGRL